MSRQPELVFKTTSPAAIEWHEKLAALRKQEWELRMAFEQEIVERFGPSTRRVYGSSPANVDGVQTGRPLWIRNDYAFALDSGYDERPPADSGWRLDSKDRNWQPKLATKEGKEWKRRLGELNLVKMRSRWQEIGIPERYWGDNYIYFPSMTFDRENGVLYIGWGTQYAEDEFLKGVAAFPDIQWERIPLSEWHAYLESRPKQDD